MEMNLTGNPIKADQALQAGLVSKVCKHDELLDEAHKTAATVRFCQDSLLRSQCIIFLFIYLDCINVSIDCWNLQGSSKCCS